MNCWKCHLLKSVEVLLSSVCFSQAAGSRTGVYHQRDAPTAPAAGNCPRPWGCGHNLGGLPGCAVGEELVTLCHCLWPWCLSPLRLHTSSGAHISDCGSKMGEFEVLCIHQNLLFLPQYKTRMLGADFGLHPSALEQGEGCVVHLHETHCCPSSWQGPWVQLSRRNLHRQSP